MFLNFKTYEVLFTFRQISDIFVQSSHFFGFGTSHGTGHSLLGFQPSALNFKKLDIEILRRSVFGVTALFEMMNWIYYPLFESFLNLNLQDLLCNFWQCFSKASQASQVSGWAAEQTLWHPFVLCHPNDLQLLEFSFKQNLSSVKQSSHFLISGHSTGQPILGSQPSALQWEACCFRQTGSRAS